MRLSGTLRALPTLLRVGFAEAVAYRAEMLVWVLATTMPLVMLALWVAVAQGAPIGRYGQPQFVGYFLATFVVRQLTGSWIFYEMNFEVRDGTLSVRLLRPIHPLVAYAVGSLAALPMRALVSLPVAGIALAVVGRDVVTHDPLHWAMWLVSIVGAWLLTLLVNLAVGCLALFIESSMKVMDLWLVGYFVLSGYLLPVEFFPARLRAWVDWLPFRFQIGLPVELMTGVHAPAEALSLLARQWAWVALALAVTAFAWKRGLGRFAAYGG